jgi:AcrR family transcriptional regulator
VAIARELLRHKGIEATSLQSVAAAAGSSVGAIQLHFGSKNGLLLAVYAEQVAEERARIVDVLSSLADEDDPVRAFVLRLWEGRAQERVSFQLALEQRAVDDAELSARIVELLEQQEIPAQVVGSAFRSEDTAELRASLNAVIASLAGLASMRHLIPAARVDEALARIVVMARSVLGAPA